MQMVYWVWSGLRAASCAQTLSSPDLRALTNLQFQQGCDSSRGKIRSLDSCRTN